MSTQYNKKQKEYKEVWIKPRWRRLINISDAMHHYTYWAEDIHHAIEENVEADKDVLERIKHG